MSNEQKLREALQVARDHIDMDALEISHCKDATLIRQALALPTAEQVDDINVAESFTSVTKTAAPVCEREAFEREMSKPPFEFCMDRWPDDGSSYAWPGNYAAYHTQCAWAAWRARAAQSAGDAVDAQRYRLIRRGQHFSVINGIGDMLRGEALDAAADAAMRKDKP